ncbi:MAG: hypothetical protein GY953_32915 [bacterium]|nr:hypothetical protein [bacterium]
MSLPKDELDARAWAEEAEKRYAEYREGLIESRPGPQVFRDAKARIEAVRSGFASLDRGEFTEYDADTIGNLAKEVKARARKPFDE